MNSFDRTKHRLLGRLVSVGALLAVLVVSAYAHAITKEEVITLAKLGIPEAEIIKSIEKDRTIFELKIQDILALKKAGVPDKVVKYMLSSKERWGTTEEGGETVAPTEDTPAEPAVPEKTEEELRAEAERMRLEAERRRKELEEAREAQRVAFADAQLAEAMDHANEGDYVAAIQAFQDFLAKGGFGPGTPQHYRARFGIAYALSKANLLQSSAKLLVEVLLEGPDGEFFQRAFYELRRLRKEINYSPPDLEELTRFYVGKYSRSFQDEYNYFLGEFFYDYNNFERALTYFDEVSESAPDYPKALYLKGLVLVRNEMYKSAVSAFQNAILAAEKLGAAGYRVLDDAYLALARIAYESQQFDAAIYYYRKLRKDSPKLAQAFYESAWTYFLKGDYSRALGTFQVLHSPFFDHYFFPELWILEATVYLNMCHYDFARDALNAFQRDVSTLAVPLSSFMQAQRTPADYYRGFVSAVNERADATLPARLTYPVLSNVEFHNLYQTLQQVEGEIAELEQHSDKLGDFGVEVLSKLNQIRQSRLNEIGIKIQQILKQVDSELEDYSIKLKKVEVDLLDVEASRLTDEQAEIMARQDRERIVRAIESLIRRGGTEDEAIAFIDKNPSLASLTDEEIEELAGRKTVSEKVIEHLYAVTEKEEEEGGSIAIVGADSLEWPYEGEYWRDEIGGFRSFLREACGK